MDRICSAVLEKICSLTAVGHYIVVSEDEFSDVLEGEAIGGETLSKAFKTLADDGYIDLRYSSDEMFCAAPKCAYVPEHEDDESFEEEFVPSPMRDTTAFKGGLLGGLIGGFAGAMIISLIFAFI